jgi:hypothetical protein
MKHLPPHIICNKRLKQKNAKFECCLCVKHNQCDLRKNGQTFNKITKIK